MIIQQTITLLIITQISKNYFITDRATPTTRAGLKSIGPIAPNWAPRPILQTLVQVNWEHGPTEIVPNLTRTS